MGRGLGPVQKAVLDILFEAERELTIAELTVRTHRRLSRRVGYGGWSDMKGHPTETAYRSVRRAVSTLPGQGFALRVEEEEAK